VSGSFLEEVPNPSEAVASLQRIFSRTKYDIRVDGNDVTFGKDGKVIAAKLVTNNTSNDHLNQTGRITNLSVGGEDFVILSEEPELPETANPLEVVRSTDALFEALGRQDSPSP
jgi:hypothetical protein